MPPRTMLPPNLSRHYYEARRRFLESATGENIKPWFQLSPLERAVIEGEMGIFRAAIRGAEEEQDLLASLDANRAATSNEQAPQEAPQEAAAPSQCAPDAATADECDCLGCASVAAMLLLIATAPIDPATIAPRASFNSPPITLANLEQALERQEQQERRRAEYLERWRTGPQTVTKTPKVEPLTREDAAAIKEAIIRDASRVSWSQF